MKTLYVAVANVDTLKLDMWANADGAHWSVKDAAHAPDWGDYAPAVWCLESGDLIYVVHMQANYITVTPFDKATETWGSSTQGPAWSASDHRTAYRQTVWFERIPCCLDATHLWVFYPQTFPEAPFDDYTYWPPEGTAYAKFRLSDSTWTDTDIHVPLLETDPLASGAILNNYEYPVAAWFDGSAVCCIQIVTNNTGAYVPVLPPNRPPDAILNPNPYEYQVNNTPAYVYRSDLAGTPHVNLCRDIYDGDPLVEQSFGIRVGVGDWNGQLNLPFWDGGTFAPYPATLNTGEDPVTHSDPGSNPPGSLNYLLPGSSPAVLQVDLLNTYPPAPSIRGSYRWTCIASQAFNLDSSAPVTVLYTLTDSAADRTDLLRAKQVTLGAGLWFFWLASRFAFDGDTTNLAASRLIACKPGGTPTVILDTSDTGKMIVNFMVGAGPGGSFNDSLIYPPPTYTDPVPPVYGANASGPGFCYGGLYDHGGSGLSFKNLWDGMVVAHPGNCFGD